ncbi:MAG: HmuY family protein, partial [Bacteroidales bacterium]|nr:HmuY family protein [Bacteroidales bacterium]
MRKFYILLAVCSIMVLFSCSKDEEGSDNHLQEQLVSGTVTINASAYDKWVYFSFDSGKVVEIDNFKNSMNWDIGFHRMDVRVNCGESGPGQGGTILLGKVDFDTVSVAPASG